MSKTKIRKTSEYYVISAIQRKQEKEEAEELKVGK